MSEARVNVSINGQDYPMACEPGEEEKVAALGKRLDEVVRKVSVGTGPIAESRLLVMAALIIIDDLAEHEAAAKAGGAGKPAAGEGGTPSGDAGDGIDAKALASRLEKLAERLEKLASGAD